MKSFFNTIWKSLCRSKTRVLPHPVKLLPDNESKSLLPAHTGKVNRIAIIVGHSAVSKGAHAYTGEQEYDYNSRIARWMKKMIENESSKKVEIFYRQPGPYKSSIKNLAILVGKWNPDLTLELHFNSYNKKAYGCEILFALDGKNDQQEARIADDITDKLAKEFKLKERNNFKFKDGTYGDGVVACKPGNRGYWNLAYMEDYTNAKYSLLIEPCFANTKTSESEQFFMDKGQSYSRFLANRMMEL